MMTEQEFLEQIADDERDFAFALRLFGGDLVRLKRVLLWQVSDGVIEIWRARQARTLTLSELKAIWCDDANFLDASHAAGYTIRLTGAGQRRAFG